MGSKYSEYTLPELSNEYFKFELKIRDENDKKTKLDEKVMELYNERLEVYNLIRQKQNEEMEIKQKNLVKYGYKDAEDTQLNRDYGMSLSDLKNQK